MWGKVLEKAIENKDTTRIVVVAGEMINFAAKPDELKVADNLLCYSHDSGINNNKIIRTFVSFRKITAVEVEQYK